MTTPLSDFSGEVFENHC